MGRRLTPEKAKTYERLHKGFGILPSDEPQLSTAEKLEDLDAQLLRIYEFTDDNAVRTAADKAHRIINRIKKISHEIGPLLFDLVFQLGQTCLVVGITHHYKPTWLKSDIARKLGVSGKSEYNYLNSAGVKTPTKGGKNHRYNDAEVWSACRWVATTVSDSKVVERAREWILEMETKQKVGD